MHHAEIIPAVTLIEANVVSDKIERGNALAAHILHYHVQQLTDNALLSICFLSVNRTDIGLQIFSVMEIVLDHTQTADDLFSIQAQIPAIFRLPVKIICHTVEIGLLRHTPFTMQPHRCRFLKLRSLT